MPLLRTHTRAHTPCGTPFVPLRTPPCFRAPCEVIPPPLSRVTSGTSAACWRTTGTGIRETAWHFQFPASATSYWLSAALCSRLGEQLVTTEAAVRAGPGLASRGSGRGKQDRSGRGKPHAGNTARNVIKYSSLFCLAKVGQE